MEFQPKDKCRKPGKKQETCFPVRLQCAEIAKQYMEFPNIPNYIMHGSCANLRIVLKRQRNSIVSDLLLRGEVLQNVREGKLWGMPDMIFWLFLASVGSRSLVRFLTTQKSYQTNQYPERRILSKRLDKTMIT